MINIFTYLLFVASLINAEDYENANKILDIVPIKYSFEPHKHYYYKMLCAIKLNHKAKSLKQG